MHTTNAGQHGIGDITSTTKGTAARYNAGKAPLELIPLRIIAEQARRASGVKFESEIRALFALARFQEGGGIDDLLAAIAAIGPAWDECAAVFDYGRAKYDEWNWAKGFAWSVPIACAARHVLFGMMAGEQNDGESKLPHRGHFLCNIVMLLTFIRTYPEGDDRPVKWLAPLRASAEHASLEEDARLIADSNAAAA
ncbi:MAG TPA: dATP/dGTP diphosphohydrolase domain-containing protein [Paraburkholderia sp.]